MSYERFTIDELQRFGLTGDDAAIMALGRRCLELGICEDKDVAKELRDAEERADYLEEDVSSLERDIEIKDEQLEDANEKIKDIEQQRDELLAALKAIAEHDPEKDTDWGLYDEWGEAESFRKAQELARLTVAKVEGKGDE